MLEDTNDIGFQAVEVKDGFGVEPGVWFRLALGGITGHRDFARDTGVIVRPEDATKVADAVVRVFIEHGDRTNRDKARMKYVLDAWGFDKFLAAGRGEARRASSRACRPEAIAPRPAFDRSAHIGVHPQKQSGLHWIGVVLPVGKLTAEQMRGLAQSPARSGRRRYPAHGLAEPADLRRRRLTTSRWRSAAIEALGLSTEAPARSAPASSPAPATPAAVRRRRHQATRRGHRRMVRDRVSRSTAR